MHFYESSIITTKDCMHLQVYGNEHPKGSILVKPKYIPTERINSDSFQSRFISGRKMNRLNMWIDKAELGRYLEEFRRNYPDYIFNSDMHEGNRLFFAVPIEKIERIYSPKTGLQELMKIPRAELDSHLKLVYDLVDFLLQSGLRLEDLGITYSSLVGHYALNISDINIVVHGKENYWKLMDFLDKTEHPLLKWKTREQWNEFRKKRNRERIFAEEEFFRFMSRKRSEGFFGGSLFVIFCAENQEETWFKWGDEKYVEKGFVETEGIVKDNFNSIVRPGYYEIENSKILEGHEEVPIKRIVFYSRDYAMIAFPGEKINAKGVLEKVIPVNGDPYYRVVIGYFDSYVSPRREQEYIKPLLSIEEKQQSNAALQDNRLSGPACSLCKESHLQIGELTDYGARIIYKIGEQKNGWFATLSPKTGGSPDEDFSIQLCPIEHLVNFSQLDLNKKLAENYGLIFAKINGAVAKLIQSEPSFSGKIPIGIYGKCKHLDEHIHFKIFPWRNNIGQPFTTDSSFEKKEVHQDQAAKEEFVKMKPVRKVNLSEKRFNQLSAELINLLN